jgi:HSP20 family protein
MARSENVESSSGRERQEGTSTAATGKSTESRRARGAEQEQQLPVSRERARRDTSLSRQQPSLVPSIFSAPPTLLSSAFISNPFGFMQRMSEEMNRIFENAGIGTTRSPFGGTEQESLATWMPQIELQQTGNELIVRADLPGVKREDVTVEVEDGVLTVSGERRQEDREERDGFVRSERRYGSFYRSIPLPEGVNEDNISATFGDGVLEVRARIPEQQQRRGKKIEIK